MDHSPRTSAAMSAAVAADVAGFPAQALEWAVGKGPSRVLELMSGSGELTSEVLALGHDVLATDLTAPPLVRLAGRLPAVRLAVARPQSIPLPASSVDVVVAGERFRTLDLDRTLPEVARVLRPGGGLSLVWNTGDHKVPWVRKMFALMGVGSSPAIPGPLETSEHFGPPEHRSFRRWQRFERSTLVEFVAASEHAARLSPDERAKLLAEAGDLYDGYGRGPDGLLMPWIVDCYRARVTAVPSAATVVPEPIDDGLLIDFS